MLVRRVGQLTWNKKVTGLILQQAQMFCPWVTHRHSICPLSTWQSLMFDEVNPGTFHHCTFCFSLMFTAQHGGEVSSLTATRSDNMLYLCFLWNVQCTTSILIKCYILLGLIVFQVFFTFFLISEWLNHRTFSCMRCFTVCSSVHSFSLGQAFN